MNSAQDFDVIVIGAGIAGASVAHFLAPHARVAIVEPTAGVTRDRVAVPAHLVCSSGERWIEAIDTGGIGGWLDDDVNGVLVPTPASASTFGDRLAALL